MDITIITEKDYLGFSIGEKNKIELQFLYSFFLIFSDLIPDKNSVFFTDLQIKSDKKVKKLDEFINSNFNSQPQLNRIPAFLRSIPEATYFYLIPNFVASENIYEYQIRLKHLNKKYSTDEELLKAIQSEKNNIKEFTKILFENYTVMAFDPERKVRLGEKEKNKRVCRFCDKTIKDGVSFIKEAHAIPEGFGNKFIFNNEECDQCNEKFGTTIEEEFLQFIDFFRVFYQIKGKNGELEIPFKGAKVKNTDSGIEIKVFQEQIELDENNNLKSFNFEILHKISLMNLYRALVKFALAVMPLKELSNFKETIKWLNGTESIINLPKIAISINTGLNVAHPNILLCIRKDINNKKIPYALVELKSKGLAFVFSIPTFKDLEIETEKSFEDIFNKIEHYKKTEWTFWDFNNDTSQSLAFKINMEKK